MKTIIILFLLTGILSVATAFHCDSGEIISDSLKCDGKEDCECGCDEHGCGTGCVGGIKAGCFDEQGNPTGHVNTGSSFINKLFSKGGSSGNNGGFSSSSSGNNGGFSSSSSGNNRGFSSSGGGCTNLHPDCDEWQKDVNCESWRYMDDNAENRRRGISGMQMIQVCARSCNNCAQGGGSSGNNRRISSSSSGNNRGFSSSSSGNNRGFSSSGGGCTNLHPDCDEWQKDVKCESWRYMDDNAENRRRGISGMQMIKVCARSCNNCGGGGGSQSRESGNNGGGNQYSGTSYSGGGGSFGATSNSGGDQTFTRGSCQYTCKGNIRGSGTCQTRRGGTMGSCFGDDWGGACSGEPSGCSSCKDAC